MIIIPERECVVITPPRTGSTALCEELQRTYQSVMWPYRHMEADGVPYGYDRWTRVGIVRNPLDRLWSLYKYLQRFGIDYCSKHNKAYTGRMRESVNRPFEEWLVENELVFTSPYDSTGGLDFHPRYACHHPLPENRKSQFIYVRPDLGTRVVPYHRLSELCRELGVEPGRENGYDSTPVPQIGTEAREYLERWHVWDLEVTS